MPTMLAKLADKYGFHGPESRAFRTLRVMTACGAIVSLAVALQADPPAQPPGKPQGQPPAQPPAAGAAAPAATWQTYLDRVLIDPASTRAQFGGCVIELPSGRVVYERNAQTPLIPASNMKLAVIAAAIDQLGKDFRFKTTLAVQGKDVILIGGGDPVLGDDRLAEVSKKPVTQVFHEFADKLLAAGVREIAGDLVIDDSMFDRQFVHPNWPTDQRDTWYEAPIGALNFNSNCVTVEVTRGTGKVEATVSPANTAIGIDNKATPGAKQTLVARRTGDGDTISLTGAVARAVTLGPMSVRDPGLFTGSVFKTVLAAKGIRVSGNVVRRVIRRADGSLPPDCRVIAERATPITDALARAGKNSLGMVAEGLIKLLGARSGAAGSWENGRAAVSAYLKKIGVPAGQFTVDEGSGLSRTNRLSAAASTRILQYAFTAGNGQFETLRESLAVSGIDGTLDKRMRDKTVKGRVFAKTGYIKGVRTLAGYIHTGGDQWLAFAFFYNQANTSKMRQSQDVACTALVNYPDLKAAAPPTVAKADKPAGAGKTSPSKPRTTGKKPAAPPKKNAKK